MIKIFQIILCIIFSQIVISHKCFALSNTSEFLVNREEIWPNWSMPILKSSDISKDLVYPNWFEGNWIIKSEDLNVDSKEPIFYKVNFFKNQMGEIVGNRAKNSESLGKEIFGENLKYVKADPKSFNNQIIYLKNNEFIESRVTGRSQTLNDDLFFADEFIIQTTHKEGLSRLNQVEVMSKFYKCEAEISDQNTKDIKICGTQYTATYGSKIGVPNLKAISTNRYKLTFDSIEN